MKTIKIVRYLIAASFLASILASCERRGVDWLILEKKPIEIQKGKPTVVELNGFNGNGPNDVGIRCAPEAWKQLTNCPSPVVVALKSSKYPGASIYNASVFTVGEGRSYDIPGFRHLFEIWTGPQDKAVIEVTFSNAPAGSLQAEIVVCRANCDGDL